MNEKFLWNARHWGIGLGAAIAITGGVLALPGDMNTWQQVQADMQLVFYRYKKTEWIRVNEAIPEGFVLVNEGIPGNHEMKLLGVALLGFGSLLGWQLASGLVPEWERLEISRYRVRQSEFELNDVEMEQATEVARWAIEIDAQQEISSMLSPPKGYMEGTEDTDSVKEDSFSESVSGFLAWLGTKDGNQFSVRKVAQLSFNGSKIPTAKIRQWVDELIQLEQAEWVDETKSEFKLLED